jgi:hypothetical protein
MTASRSRIRELEKRIARTQPAAPASSSWNKLIDGRGGPHDVVAVCTPILAKLRCAVILDAADIIVEHRNHPQVDRPLTPLWRCLSELVATPPDQVPHHRLIAQRIPHRHAPALWSKVSAEFGDDTIFAESDYRLDWLDSAIQWQIAPDLWAHTLRVLLHEKGRPNLTATPPNNLDLSQWPQGVFRLLALSMPTDTRACERWTTAEIGGHGQPSPTSSRRHCGQGRERLTGARILVCR